MFMNIELFRTTAGRNAKNKELAKSGYIGDTCFKKMAGEGHSVIECLPSMCKALGSIPPKI